TRLVMETSLSGRAKTADLDPPLHLPAFECRIPAQIWTTPWCGNLPEDRGSAGFRPLRLSNGSRPSSVVSRLPHGVVFRIVVALLRGFRQLALLALTGVPRVQSVVLWAGAHNGVLHGTARRSRSDEQDMGSKGWNCALRIETIVQAGHMAGKNVAPVWWHLK